MRLSPGTHYTVTTILNRKINDLYRLSLKINSWIGVEMLTIIFPQLFFFANPGLYAISFPITSHCLFLSLKHYASHKLAAANKPNWIPKLTTHDLSMYLKRTGLNLNLDTNFTTNFTTF